MRRGSPYFRFNSRQVLADNVKHVLAVGEDIAVLADLAEQIAVFAGQLLLFQIDQLAQRHAEDGVGLDGRERVEFLLRRVRFPEHGEAFFAQRPAACRPPGVWISIEPPLGLVLVGRGADHADHFVDVGVRQQQPFHRVLAMPGLGQQKLRAAADHRLAVADELLQQSP